ncbi:unnamed protein product [Phytophthora fragariaefolia]|uniref:Unnamed protein product n=1 Tax=Phytophthora fragariaefolia TaxID=1490495 RepID=A0A9W6XXV9_9STRA|nr:unnamed protein product [Phytophthora fragariaefolia]
MLIFSNAASEIATFQANITQRFAINKCNVSSGFVGMELSWSSAGDMLTISQRKYAAAVVKRFMGRDDKSQPRTPMECDFQRQVVDDSELIQETIRPAVGSLLYASTVSRPDLATAVRIVAQRRSSQRERLRTALVV